MFDALMHVAIFASEVSASRMVPAWSELICGTYAKTDRMKNDVFPVDSARSVFAQTMHAQCAHVRMSCLARCILGACSLMSLVLSVFSPGRHDIQGFLDALASPASQDCLCCAVRLGGEIICMLHSKSILSSVCS